jgi:hypothetical protein
MTTISAKSLKVTTILDAAAIADFHAPDGQSRYILTIQVGDATHTVDLAAKSVRRAVNTVHAFGG